MSSRIADVPVPPRCNEMIRAGALGDVRWVRTTTASVSAASSGGNLESAEAEVTRLRLGLDGSWPLALDDGAAVTPRLALGLRHDGGDAETGFGADIGGGVTFEGPAQGLMVSLEGRGVLTHEASGFRDRGLAGSLAWDPPPSNGRGPKLTLTQTVGAGASGGKDALLARETLEGLAANDGGDGRRHLEARFGYGIGASGSRFTMTPEIGLGLSDAGRDYSLGWRLTRTGSGPGSLELSLEARRRESANDNTPPGHGIGFRLTARHRGQAHEDRAGGACRHGRCVRFRPGCRGPACRRPEARPLADRASGGFGRGRPLCRRVPILGKSDRRPTPEAYAVSPMPPPVPCMPRPHCGVDHVLTELVFAKIPRIKKSSKTLLLSKACFGCGGRNLNLRPSGYETDGFQMLVIILPTRSAAASTSLSWTCA